jgi:hypothetical protein
MIVRAHPLVNRDDRERNSAARSMFPATGEQYPLRRSVVAKAATLLSPKSATGLLQRHSRGKVSGVSPAAHSAGRPSALRRSMCDMTAVEAAPPVLLALARATGAVLRRARGSPRNRRQRGRVMFPPFRFLS